MKCEKCKRLEALETRLKNLEEYHRSTAGFLTQLILWLWRQTGAISTKIK